MLDQKITSHPISSSVRLNEETRQGTRVSMPSAIAWGAFFLCLFLAALSIYKQRPPNSVPASAIPTDFSSARALRHVEAISRNARPLGSLEHARVREYILGEVASMGVAPAEFQETTVVNDTWGVPYRAAKVRNILVRLRGTGQGKAVLLVSHYDSVPTGPGAGDDSWGQSLTFILIGLILFTAHSLSGVNAQTLIGYTLIILYMMTPLQMILNIIPSFATASVSMQKVAKLGLTMDQSDVSQEITRQLKAGASWNSVELVGVTHTYHREGEPGGFMLGPINLTLEPGELLFITGGNGSGKTTLAKLLLSLYIPEEGEIYLDGKVVTDETREKYRQLFSVVFSDFHLFESLFGLDSIYLDANARKYLAQLQLDHKVKVEDGVLSTVDLSQGQRKRLGLLTAYLEDRPIYLFDEWAADQDPLFKEIFYHQLLPDLKARGKALIVISHDDRYYHVADRVIKLDSGKLQPGELMAATAKRALV